MCHPVASWTAPAFRCAAPAPQPVAAAPPPEPATSAPPKAELEGEQIELSETVQFETDSAMLVDRSKLLLDDVARELADHPEIQKVQIEGHTDSVASNDHNMKLSQERVASVKSYLVSKGVDPGRLATKAFGEAEPIASNQTEDGRARNRRVEFRILQRE